MPELKEPSSHFIDLLCIAICLCLLAACKQDQDAPDPVVPPDDDPSLVDLLPPATQEGANTMGALVDGEPWEPGGFTFPFTTLDVAVYSHMLYLTSARTIGTDDRTIITLVVGDTCCMLQEAVYPISPNGEGSPKCNAQYTVNRPLPECGYISDRGDSDGFVEITRLDYVEGIISGKFELIFYADEFGENHCDTVRITDGRFDMTF